MIFASTVRIFVASEPVDGRKSFDSLAAIVKQGLKRDPLDGSLFLFRSKSGKRAKALAWDRTGFLILHKRLEAGVFRFPSDDGASIEIDFAQLRMLLDGIQLGVEGRRKKAAP